MDPLPSILGYSLIDKLLTFLLYQVSQINSYLHLIIRNLLYSNFMSNDLIFQSLESLQHHDKFDNSKLLVVLSLHILLKELLK